MIRRLWGRSDALAKNIPRGLPAPPLAFRSAQTKRPKAAFTALGLLPPRMLPLGDGAPYDPLIRPVIYVDSLGRIFVSQRPGEKMSEIAFLVIQQKLDSGPAGSLGGFL